MNLSTNKFFNSTDIHVSSRMNEYLKNNFGYEVEGDLDTLQEAKKSLEAEQVTLKKDSYMNAKYMENMLMIETISSLLKAHGKEEVNEEQLDEILPLVGLALGAVGRSVAGAVAKTAAATVGSAVKTATSNSVNASTKSKGKKKLNAVKEDDNEEKGPDHYRWKNDSQLSIAKDRLEACMKQLDHAIQYRAENSHLLLRGGDKAGTGDLYDMKDKLEKIHDSWDEQTEYYGM